MKKGLWILTIGLVMLLLWMPTQAQDGFATNTPLAPQPTQPPALNAFATSTPLGFVPTQTPIAPIAPISPSASVAFYALPTWFEGDLFDLLYRQVQNLPFAGADESLAVQLTQYELEKRFPNAPTNADDLENLVNAFLRAPIGAVDMRPFVRRYIGAEINRQPDVESLTYNGFLIEITDAKFNTDTVADAVIHIQAPVDPSPENPLRYDDTLLALRDELGRYTFLPTTYDLPAFPFTNINSVTLNGVSDFNQDGLDEVLFVVDDGQANDRWVIVGVRNAVAVELVTPNEEIRVGKVENWNLDSTAIPSVLSVMEYRNESVAPNWACQSELAVEWKYENNFYRRSTAFNSDFKLQNTLACRLFQAEPIFKKETAEATALVEQALQSYPFDSPSADRAFITLAMLYALDGRIDNAVATAESAIATYGQDSWAGQQATTLISALASPQNTTLQICEALANASPQGACDLNALVERYLGLVSLSADLDLSAQLAQYGFNVASLQTVTEVGKATRTIVTFDLEGLSPFAFFVTRDGLYQAERLAPPSAPATNALVGDVPLGAIESLLNDDNPVGTIALVTTFQANLGDQPLSAVSQYILALAYDLTGKREQARSAYYDLWQTYGSTIWGQLAGEHLDLRQ